MLVFDDIAKFSPASLSLSSEFYEAPSRNGHPTGCPLNTND